MAGLLARPSGRRGATPAEGGGQDGAKTQKASQVAASADRVETIDPSQFSPITEPRQASEGGDAGPWSIGKTVGEIY